MSDHFEYQPRDYCVCGSHLRGTSRVVVKRFSWGDVIFLKCASCGSWCQSPVVSTAALARWVDSDEYQGSDRKTGVAYTNYLADEANRLAEARSRYRRDLARLLKPSSRVLEVGCATGSLLAILREHGHEVTGVDLSQRFVEAARSMYGLDVNLGDVFGAPLPEAFFDAVLLMGTVANFQSPAELFVRLRGLLRPGGVLVFNFPDADSLWVRLLYRERFWMFTPSARTFMTSRGCATALARAGFDAMQIRGDYQRPGLRKLLHHGRVDFLLPVIDALRLGGAAVPFAIPMPTVRLVVARSSRAGLPVAEGAA